jgi:hypothetical protein
LQVLEHPRLVTEKEDVHLIRSFLISTKPNKALWRISKETGHDKVKEFIGKDFVIIPERIFKPLEEGRGGHVQGKNFEDEMKQIKDNSHGKIEKLYGPFYYDDGSGDYWYEAGSRLNGSKAATVLLDNGEKTWTKFAVSPHVWPRDGDDNNLTDWDPMGLFLVIEGAYGNDATVKKYCSGSETVCSKSLAAAIQEVINSSLNTQNATDNIMSAQELSTGTSTGTEQISFKYTPQPVQTVQTPVQTPVELKKDENITLTKEEYDTVQKQLKEQEELRNEVSQLKQERNTNILTSVFGSIEDQEQRENVIKKYLDKDVNLVKSVYDDIKTHIVPKLIANGQTVKEGKPESKTASLKPEPKISKEESKVASIQEPTVSDFRSLLGL